MNSDPASGSAAARALGLLLIRLDNHLRLIQMVMQKAGREQCTLAIVERDNQIAVELIRTDDARGGGCGLFHALILRLLRVPVGPAPYRTDHALTSPFEAIKIPVHPVYSQEVCNNPKV